MNGGRKTLFILSLLVAVAFGGAGKPLPPSEEAFHGIPDGESGTVLVVGEELEYSVRYSFFDIGTIRFRVISKEDRGGRAVYRAVTTMDSSPGLSWLLNLHIRFIGLLDSAMFSHTWMSEDSTTESVGFRSMVFDYVKNRMFYTTGERRPSGITQVLSLDTVSITGPSQDGLSLFYFAREYVRQKWELQVPTFMDAEEELTRIRFTAERKSVSIRAVSYPVETVYLDGTAKFVGVFGVTGDFEGWFSNDAARIPILAKMKVLLGNVEIQLTSWKRGSWQPPRFVD